MRCTYQFHNIGYFQIGQKLYNEPPTSKLRFRQADMLDPKFAERNTNLQDRFHFVHTTNVIHLFDIKGQETFFRNLIYLAKPRGVIWGRQVGLAEDENVSAYRQPDGKGLRFTVNEFREFCFGISGWSPEEARFDAQLVKYDEIRAKRVDKQWVLQWSITVPRDKSSGYRILDSLG